MVEAEPLGAPWAWRGMAGGIGSPAATEEPRHAAFDSRPDHRGTRRSRQRAGAPGNDHQKLDQLLHELDGTTGREQEKVLRRIDRLVFSHAFAEEPVLWPVLRRVLPDGDDLTLRVEKEHQEVNELVAELENLPHEDPRRGERLARLVHVLREDVRDEEDVLFPRLQESWIRQS